MNSLAPILNSSKIIGVCLQATSEARLKGTAGTAGTAQGISGLVLRAIIFGLDTGAVEAGTSLIHPNIKTYIFFQLYIVTPFQTQVIFSFYVGEFHPLRKLISLKLCYFSVLILKRSDACCRS